MMNELTDNLDTCCSDGCNTVECSVVLVVAVMGYMVRK